MKQIIFILFCFHLTAQAKTFPIHLLKSDAGDDVKKTLILSPQRHLTIDLRENPRHATRNILSLKLRCGPSGKKQHGVQVFEYACGLMDVEYDEVTDSIILRLTKPNFTSVAGDCSGGEYTKNVSLKGFCPPVRTLNRQIESHQTDEESHFVMPAPRSQ
jgi:hypothetical protein